MAIDTATKRFSMMQFGHVLDVMPVPDGTIAAGDRAMFLKLYSGIALSAVAATQLYQRAIRGANMTGQDDWTISYQG